MWLESVLGVPLNVFLICVLAGGTRVLVSTEVVSIWNILGTVVSAVLLALVLHPMLTDAEYSNGLITFLVAMGSFVAKDFLTLLPVLMAQIKKDPLGLLREYLNFRHKDKPGDE